MKDLEEDLLPTQLKADKPWSVTWTMFLYLSMVANGTAFAMLGPTLVELCEQLGLPFAVGGTLFTFRSCLYLAGSYMGGIWLEKLPNAAFVFFVPLTLACVGTFVIPYVQHYVYACVLLSFQGYCTGLLDTTGNVVILTLWRGSNYVNSFTQLLYFCWGLGAFIGPSFVTAWLDYGMNPIGAWQASGLLHVPACVGLLILMATPQPKAKNNASTEGGAVNVVVLLIGAIMFAHAGLEVTFGGYLDAFIVKWVGFPKRDGAMLTSLYWSMLCFGRLVAALVTRYVSNTIYIAVHLTASFAALMMLAICNYTPGGTWAGIAIPSALFGYGLAPLFPGAMLLASEKLGTNFGARAASLVVSIGAVGEMAYPACVGLMFHDSPLNFIWSMLLLMLFAESILFAVSSEKGAQALPSLLGAIWTPLVCCFLLLLFRSFAEEFTSIF